ncbi:AraC family transcriptional regulator [Caballeronia cordobensis]|uniref:AraC family transcriptional regulator n=1 Tax=Caballeronia cordobensis TaxID=1353886 RepID=UPI00045EF4DC|nr:transcriptional regulator, AraC family [Burkholderia sp. RPE67]
MRSKNGSTTDFVHFTAGAHLRAGVEVMHASFGTHRFAPHLHETWSFGAVLSGAQNNAIGPERNIIEAGQLILMPPYRPHAGCAVGETPCQYVMLYVSDEQLRERADALGLHEVNLPATGVSDSWLVDLMAAFVFAAIESERAGKHPSPSLDRAFERVVDQILIRHAFAPVDSDDFYAQRYERRLDAALAHLKANLNEAIPLNELARHASLSPAHFCRRFSQAYGLPPHRYQLVLRIAQAKSMLYAGEDISRVALLAGFADHSHFGRQFKSCFGFPPGHLTRRFTAR